MERAGEDERFAGEDVAARDGVDFPTRLDAKCAQTREDSPAPLALEPSQRRAGNDGPTTAEIFHLTFGLNAKQILIYLHGRIITTE